MKVINLGESNTVLNTFIAQMRDKVIQKEPGRFRNNLRRVGNVFGYEISKYLDYSEKKVRTPLGEAEVSTYDDKVVLATILRAGIPLHDGLLDFFDNAECAFIAAYRKYSKSGAFHINIEYCSGPDLEGKTLILADTMLATGASLHVAYQKLLEYGAPKNTHIVCPISSIYAVEQLQKLMPADAVLWTAAIDEELTRHSYIVPGIGDAGDLAYGDKK